MPSIHSIMYVIHLSLMTTLQITIKSLNWAPMHPLLFPQTSVHLHRRWLQRLHIPGDSVGADDVIANRSTVNVQWPLQPFKHRPACTLEWLPAIWQPVGTSHPPQHCKDFRDGVWQWTVWARCLQCSVTRSVGNHSLSFFFCGCCNNYVRIVFFATGELSGMKMSLIVFYVSSWISQVLSELQTETLPKLPATLSNSSYS